MSDTIKAVPQAHELLMKERKKISLTGVTEVLSFDDTAVVLKTVCGELTVEGGGLRISSLDTAHGTLEINGNIQAFSYFDKNKEGRKGIIGRMFG